MKSHSLLIILLFIFSACEESTTPEVTQDLNDKFVTPNVPSAYMEAQTYTDFYRVDESQIIRKLDVIIVPDTSASIIEERGQIADGFDNFLSSLPGNIDTNIGVILGHGPKSKYASQL